MFKIESFLLSARHRDRDSCCMHKGYLSYPAKGYKIDICQVDIDYKIFFLNASVSYYVCNSCYLNLYNILRNKLYATCSNRVLNKCCINPDCQSSIESKIYNIITDNSKCSYDYKNLYLCEDCIINLHNNMLALNIKHKLT